MKIKRIKLQNFRSHELSTIDLARVNIVRGPNGAGKSSIAMAIEYALTGRCQVTDGAGRGADCLVRTGSAEFAVELTLEHSQVITRRRSSVGGSLLVTMPGATIVAKAAEAWIQNLAPIDVISAVLNANRFIEMDAKSQRALLADALASEPVELEAEMVNSLMEFGFIKRNAVNSAGEVDQIYKQLFDLRTLVNRDLKNLGDFPAPHIPPDMPSRKDVFEKISGLLKDRNSVVQTRTQAVAKHNMALQIRKNAQDTIDRLGANVLQDPAVEAIRKALKDEGKREQVQKDVDRVQGDLNRKRQQLGDLQRDPGNCPTCGQAQPKKDNAALITRAEKEAKDLSTELEKLQTKLRGYPDLSSDRQRLDRHNQAVASVVAAEKALKDTPDPGTLDTKAMDLNLQEIDERIANGRQIEQKVIALEEAQRNHDHHAKLAASLREKSHALDRMVEYFGDKGPLKGKLVGGRLPGFRGRINQTLARFGFACYFELDPYVLRVGGGRRMDDDPEYKGLELRQLSESEAYRFGIAFQIALAEATGVNVVVIDRADMLQPASRRELSEALLFSKLDTAIVLSTDPNPGLPSPVPEVSFINLVDGQIEFTPALIGEHYAESEV